jgi:peptide-methionine (R)-S-oxide reductase
MTKKINKDLTSEQKLVLFEDGTEAPGTSELNYEKRKGSYHCANCGAKLLD